MEIEIITTKKKLTKAIINQMPRVSIVAMKFGTSLGYLLNVRRQVYKAILIRYDGKFFILPGNYTKGERSVYRKVGKWTETRKFDSPQACDDWWEFYQDRLKEAVDQIYV